MRWFRLYTEFATDAKVQSLPEAMQRRLVMLFCLQSTGELETLDDALLAFAMRITPAELEETRQRFEALKFIAKGSWTPRNWDKRQPPSDNSTPRSQKHRATRATGTQRARNGSATEVQRPRNGDATDMQRECNGPDKNREEERREETHTGVCVKEHTHTHDVASPATHKPNVIDDGPPEWQAVVAKARQLWGDPMERFPAELREAWGNNGSLAHWWEAAAPGAFVDALVDLRARGRAEWTLARFLGFVRGADSRIRTRPPALKLAAAVRTPEEQAEYDAEADARRERLAEESARLQRARGA